MTGEAAIRIHKQSVVRKSIYGRHVRMSDLILTGLIYLCAGLSIAILAGIMGYVFARGIPNISWRFLTTVTSATKGTFGILGNIVNTLYIVVITLLIATPIGIGAAIYLNEYARPGRLVKAIEFTTETLSGIPSIIFGLFGMVFFGNTLGLKYSILTGVILAIGRIVGESAALLFTAGSGYYMPRNWLGKVMEPGGTLTIQLYLFMQKAKYNEAFGVAVVLLAIVLAINGLARYLSRKFNVETGA